MLKQSTCPIEASNIANLGSELEHKIKEAAAGHEPAWRGKGSSAGLFVWRIEKFTVQPWPTNQLGKFYKGDSYIVLHTYQKEGGNGLASDIHFWLGAETSQDEAGTAAYKTVELDDFLGGEAVQHREVQDNESVLFLSYFPERTITIMEGGIESGFNHVEATTYQPRLLWLKGNKADRIRVTQVPLSYTSLNSGDVFLLDLGLKIYQWNGKKASFFEKIQAGKIARSLRDERGEAEAFMFTEGDDDLAPFWEALGGEGPVKSADEGGSDSSASSSSSEAHRLLRLTDAGGSLKFSLEHEGELKRGMLDSSDVFVVDTGVEVYVWIGKNSSRGERKHGMQYGQQYLAEYGRPAELPLSRVVEGGENTVFEMAFVDGHFSSSRSSASSASTHSCCPHYPAGGSSGAWAFAQQQKADESPASALRPGQTPEPDVAEQIVGEVFSFFAGKIKNHFFK